MPSYKQCANVLSQTFSESSKEVCREKRSPVTALGLLLTMMFSTVIIFEVRHEAFSSALTLSS